MCVCVCVCVCVWGSGEKHMCLPEYRCGALLLPLCEPRGVLMATEGVCE